MQHTRRAGPAGSRWGPASRPSSFRASSGSMIGIPSRIGYASPALRLISSLAVAIVLQRSPWSAGRPGSPAAADRRAPALGFGRFIHGAILSSTDAATARAVRHKRAHLQQRQQRRRPVAVVGASSSACFSAGSNGHAMASVMTSSSSDSRDRVPVGVDTPAGEVGRAAPQQWLARSMPTGSPLRRPDRRRYGEKSPRTRR